MNKKYFTCECGSELFVRHYNIWNELLKVEIIEFNNEEFWKVEELGKSKNHLDGYRCYNCGRDTPELNDGI